jgi:Na+-transporting methylmalonyl-CoA/oxaloacetate decarboxylase beta subunit
LAYLVTLLLASPSSRMTADKFLIYQTLSSSAWVLALCRYAGGVLFAKTGESFFSQGEEDNPMIARRISAFPCRRVNPKMANEDEKGSISFSCGYQRNVSGQLGSITRGHGARPGTAAGRLTKRPAMPSTSAPTYASTLVQALV